MSRTIGDVILDLQNISLRFGGVKALTDISFDVREHEIRAIIGPNGAGKTLDAERDQRRSITRRKATITFRGEEAEENGARMRRRPSGIARTFQNVALFKRMSVLDNLMAGRTDS
jgi:branched-chain amino acid transport system ATP-binding protein